MLKRYFQDESLTLAHIILDSSQAEEVLAQKRIDEAMTLRKALHTEGEDLDTSYKRQHSHTLAVA